MAQRYRASGAIPETIAGQPGVTLHTDRSHSHETALAAQRGFEAGLCARQGDAQGG